MADLDQLEQKVAALETDGSPTFQFRSVLADIEAAATTATNAEVQRLRDVVSDFRGKLPGLITLKPTRAKAKDLADSLMLSTLEQAIKRINDRDEALNSLSAKLQTQIAKANADANRLQQIKDAVEKATKTVNELKALVQALNATDASTKDQLLALIEGIGNISSIFAAGV